MFNFLKNPLSFKYLKRMKELGSTGNANYEAAKKAVHKDIEIMSLKQRLDTLLSAAMDANNKLEIAVATLTALADMKTAGGGQSSTMAWHAREALNKIKGMDK